MLFTRKPPKRKGVAATEFALVLPVLLMLTFGTIEVCQVMFLKEKAVLAAHEGARLAIRKSGTKDIATNAARSYLDARGIDMSTIQAEHIAVWPTPETTEPLIPINVRVRVPIGGNTVLPNSFYTWFSPTGYVESQVVMYREFKHVDAP